MPQTEYRFPEMLYKKIKNGASMYRQAFLDTADKILEA